MLPATNQPQEVSCVDLFCGVGGLTHGFIREGLPVNAGIDIDPACRYPYEKNNDVMFVQTDVGRISSSEIRKMFTPSAFKVLAGCAPCQPFSTYSQRYDITGDPRWELLNSFARHVVGIQPDIVTMENVPSVIKHKVYQDFVDTLEAIGYAVHSQIVNCVDYGVAQTRKRLVLLASRHGSIPLVKGAEKPRTVRESIGHLPDLKAGAIGVRDRLHMASTLSPLNLKRIRASRPGGTWRDWPQRLRLDCHKEKSGETYPSVYGRMLWEEPAPTITTQCYGYGNGRFGHPKQDRAISLREAAILQGFPQRYQFVSPGEPIQFKTIGRLIGNAVPVPLGVAIARSIQAHLATKSAPKRRRKIS